MLLATNRHGSHSHHSPLAAPLPTTPTERRPDIDYVPVGGSGDGSGSGGGDGALYVLRHRHLTQTIDPDSDRPIVTSALAATFQSFLP